MDIFGAPYAHDHSFDEVAGWYKAERFSEVWPCNESRRGFGVCGRLSAGAKTTREQMTGTVPERQVQASPGIQRSSRDQTENLTMSKGFF
jgi:hypothetical protein